MTFCHFVVTLLLPHKKSVRCHISWTYADELHTFYYHIKFKNKTSGKTGLTQVCCSFSDYYIFHLQKSQARLAGGVHDSSDPPGVGMICRTFVCPGGVWHLRSLQSALSHVRPYVRLADSCATSACLFQRGLPVFVRCRPAAGNHVRCRTVPNILI